MASSALAVIALGAVLVYTPAAASADVPPAPTLEELKRIQPRGSVIDGRLKGVRTDAIREAALTYGSQSALYSFSLANQKKLQELRRASDLSATFNFGALMIEGPSGVLVMPPVVVRSEGNVLFNDERDAVTMADVEYWMRPAKLMSSAPSWRNYLLRDFEPAERPSDEVLPKTKRERAQWERWVEEGWNLGREQAAAIFSADMARLRRDFFGIIRYQKLVLEKKIHELRIAQGTEGPRLEGGRLRINDRWVRITEQAAFNQNWNQWQPVLMGREDARFDEDRPQ